MAASSPKGPAGVLLLNLGGPERLEDVRPFLYELFSDPAILRIRFAPLRRAVAWLIAATRTRTSQGYYAKIGGGSPLRRLTEEQAGALARELERRGRDVRTYVGMSCSEPKIPGALRRIAVDGIDPLVVLPLYPQFSTATTGSALDAVERNAPTEGAGSRRRTVREWYDHPGYVAALAAAVREEMARFPDPDPRAIHLLYSAHSIPQRYVDEGDPYLEQTRTTVALVNQSLGGASPWTLAFQSRVGPVKWLEPSTDEVIERLGRERTAQVLVVAVSFVSDHIETLYEIDLLYRDKALAAGIGEFRRAPALDSRPDFIAALADLVEGELAAFDGES